MARRTGAGDVGREHRDAGLGRLANRRDPHLAGHRHDHQPVDLFLRHAFEHGDGVAGRRKAGRPDHIDGHALGPRGVFRALFDDLRKVIQAMQHVTEFQFAWGFAESSSDGFLLQPTVSERARRSGIATTSDIDTMNRAQTILAGTNSPG